MALTDVQIRKYTEKLLFSRMNVMINNPFFGSLLMHVNLTIDEECESAYTDMKNICFGTKFLDEISQEEVEFVMMHEIMHIALHHCKRGFDLNPFLFNVACDIVVNSIILESNGNSVESITLQKYGESLHKLPDGSEGAGYTAEEVYYALLKKTDDYDRELIFTDDHDKWMDSQDESSLADMWTQRILEAGKVADRIGAGKFKSCKPRFVQDMMDSFESRSVDWKNLLHTFISEELKDYSFSPPDKRFQDSDFFMPDFGIVDGVERAEDILFMIDTSASVYDREILSAYSEIEYALDLFEGRLKGWIGFFDYDVVEPVAFEDVQDIRNIKPYGGGGTSFHSVFNYVKDKMADRLPAGIVIFTDGCAAFPDESAALGIPVLWIITTDEIDPPWGSVAKIKLKEG